MRVRAVFPGSFDPLTVAHLAICDAVRALEGVDEVHLALSRVALEKEGRAQQTIDDRVEAIDSCRSGRPWLRCVVTDAQLLADIATGYDILVIGADKWHQMHDVRFYGGSPHARDVALTRMPRLAIAPRGDVFLPDEVGDRLLAIGEELRSVSSTAVREGRDDWLA